MGPFLPILHRHLTQLIQHGRDRYGTIHNPMWASSLDLETLDYPEQVDPKAGQRVYREIAGPRGSVIYWDVPQFSLAHRVAKLTGDSSLSAAADDYVRYFLSIAIGAHGLWALGNHYYYDLFADQLIRFGYEVGTGPDDPSDRTHVEHRPLMMDWEVFWRVDPAATEKHIRAFGEHSVEGGFSGASGAFDRHTSDLDGTVYSFSESGGILVESLLWLENKLGESSTELSRLAKRVARFTFDSRNAETRLVPVQNTQDRWDRNCATSEIGLWAASMLKAYEYSNDRDYLQMARESVRAFVERAWDADKSRFWGKLNVRTGKPDTSIGEYRPGVYTDLWNCNFPDHEYGLTLGKVCWQLFELTGEPAFQSAGSKVIEQMLATQPGVTASAGHGAYAELFGRAIELLCEGARVSGDRTLIDRAKVLAEEAMSMLLHPSGLIRGHAGEDRYDAVDGVGILV